MTYNIGGSFRHLVHTIRDLLLPRPAKVSLRVVYLLLMCILYV